MLPSTQTTRKPIYKTAHPSVLLETQLPIFQILPFSPVKTQTTLHVLTVNTVELVVSRDSSSRDSGSIPIASKYFLAALSLNPSLLFPQHSSNVIQPQIPTTYQPHTQAHINTNNLPNTQSGPSSHSNTQPPATHSHKHTHLHATSQKPSPIRTRHR